MMFQELFNIRQSLYHKVLIAALIAFAQDQSSYGRAQAWTYNYSVTPNRRWQEARQWCQQHFTDMVIIQNQEETDFLNNLLPFNPKYYWLGIYRVAGVWTWVGTNRHVPKEAQNWAPEEPDNINGQDCVEIYIKRDKDTAKWNNEKCRSKKGTICYTASCTQDSCSKHADCVETIGNYTCRCHPGFLGPRCEEAIACGALLDPEKGSHYCFNPHGSNSFNSSCWFHCELGFRLVGATKLFCQASGHWNNPVPLCQVEQCPVLNQTSISGNVTCSHPIAPYSFNSSCEFRCDEGYELHGQEQIQCDHTGQWTASVPACTIKKCPPISVAVIGNVTCVDTLEPFSFGSQCNFTCQQGYYLTGDSTLNCLASGQWSKPTPTCTVVQCNSLQVPLHAFMQCHDLLGPSSYGSICTVQCEEGFDLIGTNVTKCSSHGNWSHALPVCQAKKCSPIKTPPHGSLSCADPNGSFSFGSRCTTTCDEGFLLKGTASTECTSVGMWSAEIPLCLAKRCPALNSSTHGSLICSDPHEEFSFGSHCISSCEAGFVLNGTAETECTSLGTWSRDMPRCLAKRCPTLNSPAHGSLSCSNPHGQFRFGSHCTSTCEEGFLLNGTADVECTSLGTWSADIPHCLAKRCTSLNPPSHGSLTCSNPHGEFSFGSRCTSACEEGFVLNGTADTECTSLGMWSGELPCCLARQCPLLDKAPQHGHMNCSHPHSPFGYGSHCDFKCNEGFLVRGVPVITCNNSGQWSQDLPTCQLLQCEVISTLPLPLSMNCSHPLGNFSFGSQCLFTCKDGFSLNGTKVLHCSSPGLWSDRLPNCTGMSVGRTMLLYTGVVVASVVIPVILIGLALFILVRFKTKGNRIMSDVPAWEERENPAFEF
uniref:E-selectin n=1 Tax=Mastacembelus armatus TaxID=205130 RepID=A0A3Q3RJK8_9TELE